MLEVVFSFVEFLYGVGDMVPPGKTAAQILHFPLEMNNGALDKKGGFATWRKKLQWISLH